MPSSSAKPRWTVAGAQRRGEQAYSLATGEYRPAIEPRLGEARLDSLRTDLDMLRSAPVEAKGDLREQKTATGVERMTSEDGHDLVMTVRNAAKRRAPKDQELHRAVGVGVTLRADSTLDVLANLEAIVKLGGDDGNGLRRIGILPDEIQEAGEISARLGGSDASQRDRIVSRSTGTESRTTLKLRVEDAIDEISAAGVVAFRKNPVKRARYEALVAEVAQGHQPPTE